MSAADLLGQYDPGSPEWDQARRGRLGGSEIAAVLGLSPWQSPFALWHHKAGNIPGQPPTPRLRVGQLLEDAVCTLFVERTGHFLRRTGMWANRERPWQVAAPDRFIVAAPRGRSPLGVFEAKTADRSAAFEWGPDDTTQTGFTWDPDTGQWLGNIPPYYVAQVLWYLDTFGLDVAFVGVLLGFEYRQYRIQADPESADLMRTEARTFLDSLEAGQAPDVDASGATYRALRQLHPEIDGTEVEVDADLAYRFTIAKGAVSLAEKEWATVRNQMADRMGQAATAVHDGERIAARRAKGGGTPWVEAARTNGKATK